MKHIVIKLISLSVLFSFTHLSANIIGTDFQLFNPTHVPDHYFTVNSSRTLPAGKLNLGMFVDAAWNSLPYEATTTGTINERRGLTDYDDILFQMDLHFAIGIMKGWDIGISVPLVFQTLKDSEDKVIFEAEGLTEARLTTKVRIMGDAQQGIALLGTISKNLIRDNPYMGEESNLNYQIQAAFNGRFNKKWDAALNIGYRLREPSDKLIVLDEDGANDTDFPITPFDDQATASAALGYNINKHHRLIWEVYGAHNLDEVEMRTFRKQTMAETVLGARYRPSQNLYFYGGVGTELIHSVASPDYRFFLGLNYTPRLWGGKKKPEPQPVVEPAVEEEVVEEAPISEPVVDEGPAEQFIAKNVLFETNSYTKILRQSREELSRIGQYLTKRGFDRIVIEGHTDSDGRDDYNLVLSQRRADSVKKYLVLNYNFPPDDILTKGYGENQPLTENETAEGKKQNRRVEFKIFDKATTPNQESILETKPQETEAFDIGTESSTVDVPAPGLDEMESIDTLESGPSLEGGGVDIDIDQELEDLER